MKVLVNRCYGGFSLSNEALAEYAKRKGYFTKEGYFSLHVMTTPDADPSKIEDNSKFISDRSDDFRTDPIAIAVVEDLGKASDGFAADIEVVEIPDGVEWQIEEYDGKEWIAEKHRTW